VNLAHGGNLFAIARGRGWDWRDIADFSASINPLGPSPRVFDAIRDAAGRIVHYPEREPQALMEALGREWSVDPDQVLVGNGATELIHFLARTQTFETVTLAVPVFSEFHRAFRASRCVPIRQNWPSTGLVVLSRPVNPTGFLPDLDPYLRQTTNPVIVDESFLEFTGASSVTGLLSVRPNLFVLRSLTKYYALPGLRIGALIGSADSIAALRAQREPWQVNTFAEVAALAALSDRIHYAPSADFVSRERAWLAGELEKLPGVQPHPSSANFLYATLDSPVAPLEAHLLEHKILIRDCGGWPGVADRNAVRIAVRSRAENERLLAGWKEFSCAS